MPCPIKSQQLPSEIYTCLKVLRKSFNSKNGLKKKKQFTMRNSEKMLGIEKNKEENSEVEKTEQEL